MIFEFSKQQIEEIRKKTFPAKEDFLLKNVFLKNMDKNLSIDLEFIIKEDKENSKIFSQNGKNFLKLKIFTIDTPEILSQISNNIDLLSLEKIINRNKSIKTLIVDPTQEYNFSKKELLEKTYNNETSVPLVFNKKIILDNKSENNFMYLGMFFYYDLTLLDQEYRSSQFFTSISDLKSDLNIFEVVDSNKTSLPTYVKDLRKINKIFEENSFLMKLKERINFGLKITSTPEDSKRKEDVTYFSNLYISNDLNNYVNLGFSFDFKKFIKNNSIYKKIIDNTEYPEDILQKCFFGSFKILRKRMNFSQKDKKFYELTNVEVEMLGESSADKENSNLLLKTKNNADFFIEEIKLNDNIKSFNVSDKSILQKKVGHYKYGIEFSIYDGYTQYLKNLLADLVANKKYILNYLSDSQRFLNYQNNTNLNVEQGYYNIYSNKFTDDYINNVFKNNLQQYVNMTLTAFIGTLNVLGIHKKNYKKSFIGDYSDPASEQKDKQAYEDSIVSLLNPSFASKNSILYFLNIYEKVTLHLERLLRQNSNNLITYTHWFKNDYVDASRTTDTGYSFFNFEKKPGLQIIGINSLIKRYSKDINTISNFYVEPNNPNSLVPYFIKVFGKEFYILDYATKYTLDDFANLEINIKLYKKNKIPIIKYIQNNFTNISKQKETYSLFNVTPGLEYEPIVNISRNHFSFNNVFGELNDERSIFKNGTENNIFENEKELNFQPSVLGFQIMKSFDIKTNTFTTPVILQDIQSDVFFDRKTTPQQIISFIEKNNKIVNDGTYLTDAKINSKFLFFFNTIHNIYITQNENIKDQKWELLTSDIINSLKDDRKYLCKIESYQDNSKQIYEFEKISLPVFDKYFYLDKNSVNTEINFSTSEAVVRPSELKQIPETDNISTSTQPNINMTPELNISNFSITDVLNPSDFLINTAERAQTQTWSFMNNGETSKSNYNYRSFEIKNFIK